MNNNKHTGFLHFDYVFYYKIMHLSKSEINDKLSQLESKINDINVTEEERINIQKEYILMKERFNELI